MNRVDNMIIQSICLLDQLDKAKQIHSIESQHSGMQCNRIRPVPARPRPCGYPPCGFGDGRSVQDLNTFAMRCREWYSWHFPELVKLVPDNYKYAQVRWRWSPLVLVSSCGRTETCIRSVRSGSVVPLD